MGTKIKAPRPLESAIQKAGMRLMTSLGVRCWRRNVVSMTAEYMGKSRFIRAAAAGQSDVWGVLPDGRHIEIEFKRPGNYPTYDQAMWLTTTNRICPAFWCDNLKTLDSVIRLILDGGRIVYSNSLRKYGKDIGPSADFDLEAP